MSTGKRNRRAGHQWERQICTNLKQIGFPDVVTTRSESRLRDADGVDIMNKNEALNGRLRYNIQAKTSTQHLPYEKILDDMPQEGINVIFHRKTTKATENFVVKGEYAILKLKDFYTLIHEVQKELNPPSEPDSN